MSPVPKNGPHVPTVAVHVSCKCSDVRSGPGGGGAGCDDGVAGLLHHHFTPALADAHTLLTSEPIL